MDKAISRRIAPLGLLILMVLVVLMGSNTFAQADATLNADSDLPAPVNALSPADARELRFTFVRIRYTSESSSRQAWATDYPEADIHFSRRFETTTGIPVDGDGLALELTDSTLWSHPFAYLVEGGRLRLSDTEISALRDYLYGGGFLLVDDFWGEREWDQLSTQLDRAFPDLEPVDLWPDHEIFRSFFSIEEKPRAPGLTVVLTGAGGERDGALDDANIRGLIDPSGRLVAVLGHNLDLGDAWEHADDPRYPREYSVGSLMLGVNIVVYALTH